MQASLTPWWSGWIISVSKPKERAWRPFQMCKCRPSLIKIIACRLCAARWLLIVNWTLGKKHQRNFYQNTKIVIRESAYENVVCKIAVIYLGLDMICSWSSVVANRRVGPCQFEDRFICGYNTTAVTTDKAIWTRMTDRAFFDVPADILPGWLFSVRVLPWF